MSTAEEITIPVPWGHIAAKAWNDSSLRPVLMVHGNLHNAGAFDQLAPLLPKDFYYVAMDIPGHGKSSVLFEGIPVNFFDYVQAVDYLVRHLKWDKFAFIGHSMGGHIGTYYSAFYPDRVTKLAIIESFVRVFTPQFSVTNILNAFNILKDPKKAAYDDTTILPYQAAIQRILSIHPQSLSVGSAHYLAKRGLFQCDNGYKFALDTRIMFIELPRMDAAQIIALLKRIECPILQIAATDSIENGTLKGLYEKSKFVRDMFKRRLGDSYQLRVVEGHHSVHIDYPERVSDHLSEFLTNM